MGRHDGPDLLAVSFSANDYVGHAKGPDSPEVREISIATDRLLGKLLDYIDSQIGAGNTLFVLTADHGVTPVPEVNLARLVSWSTIAVVKAPLKSPVVPSTTKSALVLGSSRPVAQFEQ